MDVGNEGPGLVRIEARLENQQAEDWRNAFPSSAVALPGESAVIGFPLRATAHNTTAPKSSNRCPRVPTASARTGAASTPPPRPPNPPRGARRLRPDRLASNSPQCAWPRDPELRARLEALRSSMSSDKSAPWSGRARPRPRRTCKPPCASKPQPCARGPTPPISTGSADGKPGRATATGHFRTAKVDGRWWFVDPEGGTRRREAHPTPEGSGPLRPVWHPGPRVRCRAVVPDDLRCPGQPNAATGHPGRSRQSRHRPSLVRRFRPGRFRNRGRLRSGSRPAARARQCPGPGRGSSPGIRPGARGPDGHPLCARRGGPGGRQCPVRGRYSAESSTSRRS